VWYVLEGSFELLLVNAIHIKNVPERKTHVNDASKLATALSSRRDSPDEATPLGRPDLKVEVAQEVHPQHAIDSMAEISNVHMHIRNDEPDRGELRNGNDIAAFLRYCRTHDAARNSIRRSVPDRFGNFGNQRGQGSAGVKYKLGTIVARRPGHDRVDDDQITVDFE